MPNCKWIEIISINNMQDNIKNIKSDYSIIKENFETSIPLCKKLKFNIIFKNISFDDTNITQLLE